MSSVVQAIGWITNGIDHARVEILQTQLENCLDKNETNQTVPSPVVVFDTSCVSSVCDGLHVSSDLIQPAQKAQLLRPFTLRPKGAQRYGWLQRLGQLRASLHEPTCAADVTA